MSYYIKPNIALGMGVILVLNTGFKVVEIPCKNRATAEFEAKRTLKALDTLQATR